MFYSSSNVILRSLKRVIEIVNRPVANMSSIVHDENILTMDTFSKFLLVGSIIKGGKFSLQLKKIGYSKSPVLTTLRVVARLL